MADSGVPLEDPNPQQPGPYSIGSSHWPGVSKLIEELGELQQALGKLIAVNGESQHYDAGAPLDQRIGEEMADVVAAITFVRQQNPQVTYRVNLTGRVQTKLALFRQWQHEQVAADA